MYRRFRERFGTAGLVVAIIALIAAIGGTAIAAGGLTGKQKKEVKSIAKSFQGTGPAGAQGPAGPAGANGKDGANGNNGTNGANGESVVLAAAGSCPNGGTKVTVGAVSKEICNGTNGTNGSNGTSVTTTQLDPGEEGCTEGGVKVTAANGNKVVCNGETGPPGPVTSLAPSGLLMVGLEDVTFRPPVAKFPTPEAVVGVSFPLRLPGGANEMFNVIAGLDGYQWVKLGSGQSTADCPGSYAEPVAANPKVLCTWSISVNPFINVNFDETLGLNWSNVGFRWSVGLEDPEDFVGGAFAWAYRVP